jgi:hypothetical protein
LKKKTTPGEKAVVPLSVVACVEDKPHFKKILPYHGKKKITYGGI